MPKRKLYRCKHCDHEASERVDKWQHIKTHVTPDKLLTCNSCPFVTEYKHHLEYHQRNHSNYKPFKCDQCDYQCVNRSMLKSHTKSHSTVCPYQCGQCKYVTKYAHSLKMHIKKYCHQQPDEPKLIDTSKSTQQITRNEEPNLVETDKRGATSTSPPLSSANTATPTASSTPISPTTPIPWTPSAATTPTLDPEPPMEILDLRISSKLQLKT